jgi:hypothetical protein
MPDTKTTIPVDPKANFNHLFGVRPDPAKRTMISKRKVAEGTCILIFRKYVLARRNRCPLVAR